MIVQCVPLSGFSFLGIEIEIGIGIGIGIGIDIVGRLIFLNLAAFIALTSEHRVPPIDFILAA